MTVVAWDCADDAYRELAYNGMAEEIAILKDAMKKIVAIKPEPVGAGFVTGPKAHFDAAQRMAREAIKACREVERRAVEKQAP